MPVAAKAPAPTPDPGMPAAETSALMIDVEETIEARFLPALGRLHWEEAVAVLHAVAVSDGKTPPRRYGPDDEWREPLPDPRRRYERIGSVLKRRCVAGVDYDLGTC
jgi:hypothetical protein